MIKNSNGEGKGKSRKKKVAPSASKANCSTAQGRVDAREEKTGNTLVTD